METTLLQELSNADIDWLLRTGELIELTPETILLKPGQRLEALYILLDGTLALSIPETETDLLWLSNNEMTGALPGVEMDASSLAVRATTRCWVLALERSTLLNKLQEDTFFAAHLYRAIAIQIANHLASLTQQLAASDGTVFHQTQRDSITMFAALHDDDLDWLIGAGQVQHLAAGTILVQSGRPMDAWYILLEGAVALMSVPVDRNPLLSSLANQPAETPETEVGRLSRGDTIGELQFIQSNCADLTAIAVRETQVLAIPRWRLAAKLLHDPGFAARFYQILTVLLVHQMQAMMQQFTGQESANHAFDSQFLTRVELAEARFEWLLKRIPTKVAVGGGVKW
ncbi:MAG: cyclic nucleotide-binding domain-containing protein (plasmid) [Leptolyngbya sp. BL-A-14]